jgi:DNA invertase Pin-like site-specific DNA recombinase
LRLIKYVLKSGKIFYHAKMKIGYIRVSTLDQKFDLQKDELEKLNCDKIFQDKISGSLSKSERPGLKEALEYLREGDTLIIWKLDRLGRSLKDLIDIINQLEKKKVSLKTITGLPIDTSSSSGKLIFHIFAALAEFEKGLITERVNAGIKSARSRGVVGGRPTKITPEKIKMAKHLHSDQTIKITNILNMLDVKKTLFYKMLKM